MGKPATAYFCENGHLLDESAHHGYCTYDLLECKMLDWNDSLKDRFGWDEDTIKEFDETQVFPPCPHCGSTSVASIIEWGDDDYDQEVPTEPIRKDEVEKVDRKGNKYFIEIPVYDVSKLFQRGELK